MSPYVAQLGLLYPQLPWLPFAVFSSTAIICGLLVTLLPETRHMRLPRTIREAENINNTRLEGHQEEEEESGHSVQT